MTVLGIRYLRGYSVSRDAAKDCPEWPPHPGRIFMALAAAHFETGEDEAERRALEWLEQESAPSIAASGANERSTVTTYAPVNDKSGGITGRSRQPRSFSTVRPERDEVFLIWQGDAEQKTQSALDRICRRVTRIGHSSSLVQMWVASGTETPAANWVPVDSLVRDRMRVPEAGTIAYLERSFAKREAQQYTVLLDAIASAKGREKNRLNKELDQSFPLGAPGPTPPQLTKWQGYAPAGRLSGIEPAVRRGPFDSQLIVFAKDEGRAWA